MEERKLSAPTGFPSRTMTFKVANPVLAGPTIVTWHVLTIIFIESTMFACPAIDANTDVRSNTVHAGATILTQILVQGTFINVFITVFALNSETQ